MTAAYEGLLAALTSIPRLDNAACRGEYDRFEHATT